MSQNASVYCSRLALRLALISASAAALAGCAGSERLSDPLGNPFATAQAPTDPAPTASINPSAPVTPVQSRPLSTPAPYAASPAAPTAAPRSVASIPAAPRALASASGWTAAGGTPVSVAQGDSVETLSRRYGVPSDALLKANGFASAAQVQPGARIVIPVYHASSAPAAMAAPAPVALTQAAPAKVAPAQLTAAAAPARSAAEAHAQKIKLLKPAPQIAALAPAAAKPEAAPAHAVKELAQAKQVEAKPAETAKKTIVAKAEPLKAVDIKTVPVGSEPGKPAVAAKGAPAGKPDTAKTAALAKPEPARTESARPKAEAPVAETHAPEPEAADAKADAGPEFRWPARGRIIQAFKPGGNDGINIAVPEGTSVKAAEGGVVAYAGSELKGYGNLVLIRHPNGFVSAYANNSDIEVKRGETVKRGQVIARSGQSGNVASPQLHFELRKGATPVDPTQYLAGL